MRFGGVIASLLAFPAIFAIKALYWLDHQSASIVVVTAIFLLMIIVQVALNTPGEEDSSMIVVDRVVGMSIAFMYVPFSVKFLVIGFLLFHFFYYVFPLIIQSAWKIDVGALPGVLAVSVSSMVSGLVVQLFFRILTWLIN